MSHQLALLKKEKLLFVHIPKCGGTSLKAQLYKIFGKDKVLKVWNSKIGSDVSVQNFSDLDVYQALAYSCIAGHLPYQQAKKKLGKNVEKYFVCALVREPISRVISLWNYGKTNLNHPAYDQFAKMNFEEFVNKKIGNQQCKFICGRPDASYALEVIQDEYDLVMPLEKYDTFLNEIGQKFKFSVKKNEVKNQSKKILTKKDISPNLLSLINKKTFEDIALYNKLISS